MLRLLGLACARCGAVGRIGERGSHPLIQVACTEIHVAEVGSDRFSLRGPKIGSEVVERRSYPRLDRPFVCSPFATAL